MCVCVATAPHLTFLRFPRCVCVCVSRRIGDAAALRPTRRAASTPAAATTARTPPTPGCAWQLLRSGEETRSLRDTHTVVISTGEYSTDLYATRLLRHIRAADAAGTLVSAAAAHSIDNATAAATAKATAAERQPLFLYWASQAGSRAVVGGVGFSEVGLCSLSLFSPCARPVVDGAIAAGGRRVNACTRETM